MRPQPEVAVPNRGRGGGREGSAGRDSRLHAARLGGSHGGSGRLRSGGGLRSLGCLGRLRNFGRLGRLGRLGSFGKLSRFGRLRSFG
jgi:hypothetical protein